MINEETLQPLSNQHSKTCFSEVSDRKVRGKALSSNIDLCLCFSMWGKRSRSNLEGRWHFPIVSWRLSHRPLNLVISFQSEVDQEKKWRRSVRSAEREKEFDRNLRNYLIFVDRLIDLSNCQRHEKKKLEERRSVGRRWVLCKFD